MPRPRRIHIVGGTYFVTLSGNGQQPLLGGEADRIELERLFALALRRCHARAHAFCWLIDRLLIAIEISDTPLGQFVQRFASPYAHRVQQCARRSGHLFARRYEAVLVEPSSLPDLVRYIHRSPVRAQLVNDLNHYAWSSHRAYLGRVHLDWLTTQPALRALSHHRAEARRRYVDFVGSGDAGEVGSTFDIGARQRKDSHDRRIIGGDDFRRAIAQRTSEPLPFESVDQLIDLVCQRLHLNHNDVLSIARHRYLSRARAVIAWYATRTGLATLKQIAGVLGRHTSTLSVAMDRYQSSNPELFRLASIYRLPGRTAAVEGQPQKSPRLGHA